MAAPPPSQRLPPHEIEALRDIYRRNGGEHWQYHAGTDVVGGGARWNVTVSPSTGSLPDPCGEGWFGVECQNGHVVKLFVNTRSSGNPMVGELSPLIGQLSELEHFYSSNDKTPSALVGGIPASFGNLTKLKCMYFSHNNLTERSRAFEQAHASAGVSGAAKRDSRPAAGFYENARVAQCGLTATRLRARSRRWADWRT